jgi:hypothetical protein
MMGSTHTLIGDINKMKIRANSAIKLTNGRVNMNYTFIKGTELEHVAKQLLIELACQNGKESVTALAKKVYDDIN